VAEPEVEQMEELKQLRMQLEQTLEEVKTQLDRLRSAESGNGTSRPKAASQASSRQPKGRPVRAVVLDALDDLGWPAYSRELALYCEARYGRSIAPTRFGSLLADETQAFRGADGRSRPVWLCVALTSDRHQPIKRLLARSDWRLEHRIHGPTTGRIQHLRMTTRLCDLALRADEIAVEPDMMRIIAADHARDLPGVTVRRGEFDLERWRDVAAELLEELGPADELVRRESADRLARRSLLYQLYGIPDVIEGFRPETVAERGRA
jgi:hypothetical protein